MSIVPNEAVMRNSPEISLRTANNSQPTIISLPNWRFIQPLHQAHSQTRMHANKRETLINRKWTRIKAKPIRVYSRLEIRARLVNHEWTLMDTNEKRNLFMCIRGFGSMNSREKVSFRVLFAVSQASDPIGAAPGTS